MPISAQLFAFVCCFCYCPYIKCISFNVSYSSQSSSKEVLIISTNKIVIIAGYLNIYIFIQVIITSVGLLTVIFLSSEETCETQETKETVQFACQHNLSLTDVLVTRVSLALGGKQREVLGTKLFCLALLFVCQTLSNYY